MMDTQGRDSQSLDSEESNSRSTLENGNNQSSSKKPKSPLTSKKFRLKESLRNRIDELAEEHYQGNSSQLIRTAINDHARTLAGENEFEIQKLHSKFEGLKDEVEELSNNLSDLNPPKETDQRQQISQNARPAPISKDNELQNEVYDTLTGSDDGGLQLAELKKRTGGGVIEVERVAEELVERGLLKKVSSIDQPTYAICTSDTNE